MRFTSPRQSSNARSFPFPPPSELARVLLVSHGLSANRQSSVSDRTSPTNTEAAAPHLDGEQARSTANAMLSNLRSIGEDCLMNAGQLAGWIMQTGSSSNDDTNQHSFVLAEQVSEHQLSSLCSVTYLLPLYCHLNSISSVHTAVDRRERCPQLRSRRGDCSTNASPVE